MKEIIESGILEEYVLGTLPDTEAQEIARLCAQHPELATEVEAIERALLKTYSAPVPGEWKKATMTAIRETPIVPLHQGVPTEPKVIPIAGNARSRTWFWAAASFAGLFILSATANFFLLNKTRHLSEELTEVKVKLLNETEEKTVFAAGLKQTRENYRNLFQKDFVRVNMEATPAYADPAVGMYSVLYWNPETGEVVWDGSSLPALSEEEQYQLWAIVDGKPQNAGTMHALEPTPMLKARSAQAFAVTIEPTGGSEVPTLDKMVVFAPVKTTQG